MYVATFVKYLDVTPEPRIDEETPAETVSKCLEDYFSAACDACIPPHPLSTNRRHKPVHWWSAEIGELRKLALKVKRAYT